MKQNICYRKIKPCTADSVYPERALALISNAYFNPLFPRGKRPRLFTPRILSIMSFQSTLPSREETHTAVQLPVLFSYFNPLFPRGKRLICVSILIITFIFQSTLPSREETCNRVLDHALGQFQSTLPSREETYIPPQPPPLFSISIHSSLAGRDQ